MDIITCQAQIRFPLIFARGVNTSIFAKIIRCTFRLFLWQQWTAIKTEDQIYIFILLYRILIENIPSPFPPFGKIIRCTLSYIYYRSGQPLIILCYFWRSDKFSSFYIIGLFYCLPSGFMVGIWTLFYFISLLAF